MVIFPHMNTSNKIIIHMYIIIIYVYVRYIYKSEKVILNYFTETQERMRSNKKAKYVHKSMWTLTALNNTNNNVSFKIRVL